MNRALIISANTALLFVMMSVFSPTQTSRAYQSTALQIEQLRTALYELQQSVDLFFKPQVLGAKTDTVSGMVLRYDLDTIPSGTVVGNPTIVSGIEGSGAVAFDGDDGINLGQPSELNITNSITFSAWVRPTANQPSGWGRVLSRTNGATTEDWGIVVSNTNILDCRINGSKTTNHPLSQNVWQHVACTYDGSTVRAYVNGQEVHSYSRSGSLDTDQPVAIGYSVTGGATRHFIGQIDDVRVYNRALSSFEVNAIMGHEDGVSPIPNPEPTPTPIPNPEPTPTVPPSSTPLGQPYGHVTPNDVGKTIGIGVVGSVPTVLYTGSNRITSPTLIENRIINGCLSIESDNVTIRNSKVTCGGLYPIKLAGGAKNFVFEYNEIMCTSRSKMFYFQSGGPDAKIRYNHGIGCDDFFFMDGNLNGVEIAYNYIHTTTAVPTSHSDGFQIGQNSRTYGDIRVFGNWFDPNNPDGGETGLLFSTKFSEIDLTLENNRIYPWGYYTLRCGGSGATCVVKNNVFSTSEETEGNPIMIGDTTNVSCNRYQDGTFPSTAVFASNNKNNCPAFSSSAVVIPTPDSNDSDPEPQPQPQTNTTPTNATGSGGSTSSNGDTSASGSGDSTSSTGGGGGVDNASGDHSLRRNTSPATTIPRTYSFNKNISFVQSQSNESEDVRFLEQFLNEFEGENLILDGVYSSEDTEAVKRFQRKYKREVLDIWNLTEATGFVGVTTRLKMNFLLKGVTAQCPVFTQYNGGVSGVMVSPEIGKTQELLRDLDMYNGAINNTWDSATNEALIRFQETFREVMLDPWNITIGTGYKYKTTNKFLNYMAGCDTGSVFLEGVGEYQGL
jgi:hypothetical protein